MKRRFRSVVFILDFIFKKVLVKSDGPFEARNL